MDYWELRDVVKRIVPRRGLLERLEKQKGLVKEKGRKSNYYQFNLQSGQLQSIQRLLNKEEIRSFLEVSLRAAHCPMPLNADLYDGLRCPFACRYCFSDSFRASLYTSFFDNSKNLGLRTCSPSFFRSEMDKLLNPSNRRSTDSDLQRAVNLRIPIRLGIRFEDFLPIEGRKKICLDFLSYLRKASYPIMVNTKSSLIGRDDYVRELAENKGGAAVHMTVISASDVVNRALEPGAPSFDERMKAVKSLSDAGVRVVARIEPFMVFINDGRDEVDRWIRSMTWAGVRHITLDTYSWSASTPGIRRQMELVGVDFERLFLLMADAQWLGSLLLGKFMEYLRKRGFRCSTFDFGNVPSNDQDICCEVGDWFIGKGAGFSYGNGLMAIRFIQSHKGRPVSWDMYDDFVESKGGWLSKALRQEVFRSWNLVGNDAYALDWAAGIEPFGMDWRGERVWVYNEGEDFRKEMLRILSSF